MPTDDEDVRVSDLAFRGLGGHVVELSKVSPGLAGSSWTSPVGGSLGVWLGVTLSCCGRLESGVVDRLVR